MAYGKIKADAVIWDNSGTDVEESMSNIAGKLNASGGAMTGNLTLNAQNELRLADSDSSNYIALKSPATVASDVTLTLPDSVGTAGQFLQVGAGGVTTWATALNLILQTDAAVADALIGSASSCTNPVILSGTLPYSYTYQWQFAPSGSSTFTNISFFSTRP